MPTFSNTAYLSDDIFVGREQEISKCLRLTREDQEAIVINICGEGGIGKTKLVHKIYERLYMTTRVGQVIDLYDTHNHAECGLLSSIACSLSVSASECGDLWNAISEYEHATPESRYGLYHRVIMCFRDEYARLTQKKRTVLFFDTFDEEYAVGKCALTLVAELIPWLLERNTCVVVAGRQRIEHPGIASNVHYIQLGGFSCDEGRQYAERKYLLMKRPYNLSNSVIENIVERSRTRPIIIALSIDLMLNNTRPYSIISIPDTEYERTLVSWIRKFGDLDSEALLYMAIIPRCFDAGMLKKLMEISEEESAAVLSRLGKLSFVKYHEDGGACALHDEMRDMINTNIGLPPAIANHVRILAVHYLKEKMQAAEDKKEKDELLTEWLRLSFVIDNKAGFLSFVREFETALDNSCIELCNRLLDDLSSLIVDESEKSVTCLLSAELMILECRLDQAASMLERLIKVFEKNKQLYARATLAMGRCMAMQGEMAKAVDMLMNASAIYEELAESHSIMKCSYILGDIYYWAGRYDEAIACIKEVLKISELTKDEHGVSNALGIMGNVRRRQGQHDIALALCSEALKHARGKGTDLDCANALRNMANIKRDMRDLQCASDYYEKALDLYKELNDYLGVARTLSEYAWCKYVSAEYEASKKLAYESIDIKEKYHFNNELATTYHTLFEISMKENDILKAYHIAEKFYALATRYSDGYMAMDGLHHLAILEYEFKMSREHIMQRLDKISLLASQGYKYLLFQGRAMNLRGHLALDEGNAEAALEYYKKGCSMIIAQGGTATGMEANQLVIKEMELVAKKLLNIGVMIREEFVSALNLMRGKGVLEDEFVRVVNKLVETISKQYQK